MRALRRCAMLPTTFARHGETKSESPSPLPDARREPQRKIRLRPNRNVFPGWLCWRRSGLGASEPYLPSMRAWRSKRAYEFEYLSIAFPEQLPKAFHSRGEVVPKQMPPQRSFISHVIQLQGAPLADEWFV